MEKMSKLFRMEPVNMEGPLEWQEYARHWIYIKEKYGLGYAPGELEALGGMLGK